MSAKNILVVDDAATIRMYHRKMLGDAGWIIDEAVNGMEALEKIAQREQPFDLYVSDINMPRMDGYAFVKALRARTEGTLQAPVLMVSTEAQSHDAEAAFAAGANAYLVKPARSAELVLTVALLLGDRQRALRAAADIARGQGPAQRAKAATGRSL
ncbi:response regulator [Acidovorax lacteus]|uniref:Response regulator n=1 Tax=Acidovorax lacteus TaxID=1924988 RepID=A0ABP8L8X2_9BURK